MKSREQEILSKYCSECGDLLTIGKKCGPYCPKCNKRKKEKADIYKART